MRGEHCVTCANIARAMPLHGLLLFGYAAALLGWALNATHSPCSLKGDVRPYSNHHPHRFGLAEVADLLRTFTQWSARTREHAFDAAVHAERDAVAPYATLLWNCMPKARTRLPRLTTTGPHGGLRGGGPQPNSFWLTGGPRRTVDAGGCQSAARSRADGSERVLHGQAGGSR